jgi:hypothetical protein
MNIRDKQFEREVYEEKRSSFEKNKKKTLKEIEDIKNNYEDQVKKITKEIEDYEKQFAKDKKKSLVLMIAFPIFIKKIKNNLKSKELILKAKQYEGCDFNIYKLKKERDELLETKYNDLKIWDHYIGNCNKIINKITKEIEKLYYKENQKAIENSNGKIVSFKKRSR